MSITKCRAIVIRTVNYSETSVVLTCYTDVFGLQSYMVNGVRSKKGSIRLSQLQLLNLLELEVYHQQNKSLHRIKELRCFPQLKELHFHIIKSSIAIFIAEVLNRSIREENSQDEPLFEFLFHFIQLIDLEQDKLANLPLYFLLQLTRHTGFYPKGVFDEEKQNGFDIKEGSFNLYNNRNLYQLGPELSKLMSALLSSSIDQYGQVMISSQQRHELMDALLLYYREHIAGFYDLKSHKVLSEVL